MFHNKQTANSIDQDFISHPMDTESASLINEENKRLREDKSDTSNKKARLDDKEETSSPNNPELHELILKQAEKIKKLEENFAKHEATITEFYAYLDRTVRVIKELDDRLTPLKSSQPEAYPRYPAMPIMVPHYPLVLPPMPPAPRNRISAPAPMMVPPAPRDRISAPAPMMVPPAPGQQQQPPQEYDQIRLLPSQLSQAVVSPQALMPARAPHPLPSDSIHYAITFFNTIIAVPRQSPIVLNGESRVELIKLATSSRRAVLDLNAPIECIKALPGNTNYIHVTQYTTEAMVKALPPYILMIQFTINMGEDQIKTIMGALAEKTSVKFIVIPTTVDPRNLTTIQAYAPHHILGFLHINAGKIISIDLIDQQLSQFIKEKSPLYDDLFVPKTTTYYPSVVVATPAVKPSTAPTTQPLPQNNGSIVPTSLPTRPTSGRNQIPIYNPQQLFTPPQRVASANTNQEKSGASNTISQGPN